MAAMQTTPSCSKRPQAALNDVRRHNLHDHDHHGPHAPASRPVQARGPVVAVGDGRPSPAGPSQGDNPAQGRGGSSAAAAHSNAAVRSNAAAARSNRSCNTPARTGNNRRGKHCRHRRPFGSRKIPHKVHTQQSADPATLSAKVLISWRPPGPLDSSNQRRWSAPSKM